MPTLDWIGKEKVINHHMDVPYRVLEKKYSFGDDNKNKIIHGDNLEALKALLPEYEGRIKCVYIDPPYNTGNEGWVYNDNVNDPKISRWLGNVVGKEGEDLSRHDKWLCMMYPRLKLLSKLMANDGVIFISIDDNEQAYLKLICDEIFGNKNFMADLIWQHSVQSNGYGGKFVSQFNHTLVYSKSDKFILKNLPRTEEDNKLYKNPDNDPNGPWRSGYCVNGLYRPNLKYEIETPSGKIIPPPDKGWRWSKETLMKKMEKGEILFNEDETNIIHKLYLKDLEGKVPENIWAGGTGGTTRQATAMLKEIFGGKAPFDTPKPVDLIKRIITISTNESDIILDSFAGSGTTGHAVLDLNFEEKSNRQFILIEMGDYAESITAERCKRVIAGYGEGKNCIEGTGGGFNYYELGAELFLDGVGLNSCIEIDKICRYIWHTESHGEGTYCFDENTFKLGVLGDIDYYFFYKKEEICVLNYNFLARIKEKASAYVIYADKCQLSEDELIKYNITFKKIPRDITRL